VSEEGHEKPTAPRSGSLVTPTQVRILDAAEAILQDPNVSDQDRAFIARQVVRVTLPHADPGDKPVWTRSNGYLTLSIRPGWDHEQNCARGYPHGTLPRLLLFWMATEAVRTGSRRLELGPTLASFMRDLGLDPGREVKRRLSTSRADGSTVPLDDQF
jgi:Plasmid encoded RepA protein